MMCYGNEMPPTPKKLWQCSEQTNKKRPQKRWRPVLIVACQCGIISPCRQALLAVRREHPAMACLLASIICHSAVSGAPPTVTTQFDRSILVCLLQAEKVMQEKKKQKKGLGEGVWWLLQLCFLVTKLNRFSATCYHVRAPTLDSLSPSTQLIGLKELTCGEPAQSAVQRGPRRVSSGAP